MLTLLIALALWALSAMRAAKSTEVKRNTMIGSALNNLGQGIVIVNAQRRIIFCNDRYLEIYDLKRNDIAFISTGPELLELRRSRGMFNLGVDEFRESARRDTGYVTDLPNGKSILVRHRRLPDGGAVSTHDDCTEQVSLSRQLATTKQFLESVIDNVPVGIAAKSIDDGRYILANRAFETFWQVPREQVLGKCANEIFSAANAATVSAADRNVVMSATGHVRDEIIIERDGKYRTLSSNRIVARDHNGEPVFLIVLFEDVTDHIALSRELENTRQFLELVIDNIPVSLSVQDPIDLRYLLLNRAAEFILNRPREEAVGLTTMEIFNSPEATLISKHDRAAIQRGGVVVEEQPVSTRDGLRMFLTRRATVLDDAGQPKYLIKTRET